MMRISLAARNEPVVGPDESRLPRGLVSRVPGPARTRRSTPRHRLFITRITSMQALSDVYTIPQEHLDFCATIGQIAREKIPPRSPEFDERAEYPWDIGRVHSE